jgi:hypothetical protein
METDRRTDKGGKKERKKGREKEYAKKERKKEGWGRDGRISLLLQTKFCKLFFILIEPEKINLKVFFALSVLSAENSVPCSIRILEDTSV